MPNIREYTNKVDIQPDERGLAALGRSAQAVGSEANSAETAGKATGEAFASIGQNLGSAIADVGGLYDKYKTQQDISRAGPTLAYMKNQWDQQWQETLKTSDPSDPETRQKFIDEVVQPGLDKFSDGFGTQEGKAWAAGQIKDTLDHQYAKTAADQATISGAVAVQNQLDFSNYQNNNVKADPTAYANASKALDDYHDATVAKNPSLSAADQSVLYGHLSAEHKKLAYSQVQGMLEANPTQGMAAIQAGQYDTKWFDTSEVPALMRYGKWLENAQTEGQKAAAAAQHQADIANADNALKGQLGRITYNPDGTANVPPDYLATVTKMGVNMPGMTADKMRAYTDYGQRLIREATAPDHTPSDPSTYAAAVQAIASGTYSPGDLTQAILKSNSDGHLSLADTKGLVDRANKSTENRASLRDQNAFITSLKKGIDKTILGQNNDPQGAYNAYQFQKFAETTLDTEGDTPQVRAKIVAAVPIYALTGRQAVTSLINRSNLDAPVPGLRTIVPHTAAVPRAAGESAAAYLKRTGG